MSKERKITPKQRKQTGDTKVEPKKPPFRLADIWSAQRRLAAKQTWDSLREWWRISSRRAGHVAHGALAVHRTIGPISFLGVALALGIALTLTTLYATSYAVTVNGEVVGVVAEQAMVEDAIQVVEEEGTTLLGYDYQIRGEIDYQFGLSLKTDLTQRKDIEEYFYQQLSTVSDHLRKCEVIVDGRTVGVVKDEDALNGLLDEMKAQFVTENTVTADFVEDLSVKYVYSADDLMTIEEMNHALEANTTGETTYTVAKGDTFNGIAYVNDMSLSDLKALNPGTDINRLMIGDVLNVKEIVPTLSVQTTEHVTYRQSIDCPVETVNDDNMYKGTSKITTQGKPGEAEIQADVTYVNGYEKERTILSTVTLREPTTTVKAVGTKEKPKTASKGTYVWPISGKISSYFGGRYIFGGYSYHSGLDIQASYGATIKAADGGTVTFSGTKGSYGKLVIITHDNGVQTYYAHNSSLVVSAGDKVYQGQAVAKAGRTGRATGVHCHFEVRVRGTAVNPLNYLR